MFYGRQIQWMCKPWESSHTSKNLMCCTHRMWTENANWKAPLLTDVTNNAATGWMMLLGYRNVFLFTVPGTKINCYGGDNWSLSAPGDQEDAKRVETLPCVSSNTNTIIWGSQIESSFGSENNSLPFHSPSQTSATSQKPFPIVGWSQRYTCQRHTCT